MRKSLLSVLLLFCLLLSFLTPVKAASLDVPAPSAILMDAATGTILWEKNIHERLAPASVTKIMTLLLVMEALDSGRIHWDDTIITSAAAAAKGGSQVYLEVNEQMSLQDMIKCVVVSSANDCATALAEHVAGSEEAFVELMNQRVKELGLSDTNFVNCTGLDDEPNAAKHRTSVHDLAVISRELLRHDEIRNYTTIWMDSIRDGQFGLSNTNKLVRFYNGTTGLKTGYTSAAGHCLSASAARDGIELIAVVLHCSSSTDRFESAKSLLDYGFANWRLYQPEVSDLESVPVILGNCSNITPILKNTDPVLLTKGKTPEQQIELSESVTAPVEAGQQLGMLRVCVEDDTIAEIPLVAAESVARLSWWQLSCRILRMLCLCDG